MQIKWKIAPVKSSGPVGYKWRWIKTAGGKIIDKCDAPFDYYYDCLTDARRHGYAVDTKKAG